MDTASPLSLHGGQLSARFLRATLGFGFRRVGAATAPDLRFPSGDGVAGSAGGVEYGMLQPESVKSSRELLELATPQVHALPATVAHRWQPACGSPRYAWFAKSPRPHGVVAAASWAPTVNSIIATAQTARRSHPRQATNITPGRTTMAEQCAELKIKRTLFFPKGTHVISRQFLGFHFVWLHLQPSWRRFS